MSVFLYVCISVCLYFCMSVFLYVCISTSLSFCMSASLYFCISVFQTKEKSIHSCAQFQFGRQQSPVAVTTFREDCPDFFYSFNNSRFYVCTQWRFGKRNFRCRDTKIIGKSSTTKIMFKFCIFYETASCTPDLTHSHIE